MSEAVIVAIDGPSGVGKSTTSRRVATQLRIPHIDTGAMYRAVALKAMRQGVDPSDPDRAIDIARAVRIELVRADDGIRTILDGEDVSNEIRTPPVGMAASTISAIPGVRRRLVEMQREVGRRQGGVLEGRDIGTKVFPETPHKFFLTARPEVRAERRHRELAASGRDVPFRDVLEDLEQRDRQDSTREDSPLRYDESYVVIDTSEMTIDDVVRTIVESVRARLV